MTQPTPDLVIDAEPTKTFFVDMLTRDIALEQAVLDLVDNTVDAAKGMAKEGPLPFDGCEVSILLNSEYFKITDNCGGFDSQTAASYAFKFGRPTGTHRTPHSIGQFGVGMKRALFKFGHHFNVRSATKNDSWCVDVDVHQWETQPGWSFPWGDFVPDRAVSQDRPGTEIIVTSLRPEVSTRFATDRFKNTIITLIKSKHRQFISGGLRITVNGTPLTTTNIFLLVQGSNFRPGVQESTFTWPNDAVTKIKIIVGLGNSSPKEAGWYVICNGRVILEADRRDVTGWGVVEEMANGGMAIPSFHNQYARFRGIVTFDSDDSAQVPWNTTKTDVDQDSPVWRQTATRMMEMMRPVINFLNELDADIDEHTRDDSPMYQFVSSAALVKAEDLPAQSAFVAPPRGTIAKKVRTIKIQYSRPVDKVDFLMSELSLGTAKSVGEKAFDLLYERMGGE
ncbi:ATP-binding protein [Massilia sp. IC2-476]|uniref:ATP-binding protein n=1 Tax=Massilia sp. IC2-476 TaxID=2887199 RepID=UPI001D12DD51|nr:ATP-binding protein [Massilia sp. IC2-476]MCC2972669.1 ATP-binding protein [Massilia sp. IC2-476]